MNKWLGRHSESVMSSSFPHFSTSEQNVFTAQCPIQYMLPSLKVCI